MILSNGGPDSSRTIQHLRAENDALRSELDDLKRGDMEFITNLEHECNDIRRQFLLENKSKDEEIIIIKQEYAQLKNKYEMSISVDVKELMLKYEQLRKENETLLMNLDSQDSREESFIEELEKEMSILRSTIATSKVTSTESIAEISQLKAVNESLRRELDDLENEIQRVLEKDVNMLTDMRTSLALKEAELTELRRKELS
jgi:chromosome segregation ATPase